jgi:hypothetical protein
LGELPPWLTGKERLREQNRSSRKQETARAAEVGGKRQRGSGSKHQAPRDVKTATHLEELKETDGNRITIDARDFAKLQRQGRQQGRSVRFVVEFKQHGLRLIIEEG